ncbi:unnamed protein product, partial [marine sediment metagenome]
AGGSMVVLEKGLPKPNLYRRFHIKMITGADDYAMIQEILKRRFKRGVAGEGNWAVMPGSTCPLVVTSDFAYIRLHGSATLYSSCYSDKELAQWAKKIVQLGEKVEAVFIYFNNDAEAFAVKNALTLVKFIN